MILPPAATNVPKVQPPTGSRARLRTAPAATTNQTVTSACPAGERQTLRLRRAREPPRASMHRAVPSATPTPGSGTALRVPPQPWTCHPVPVLRMMTLVTAHFVSLATVPRRTALRSAACVPRRASGHQEARSGTIPPPATSAPLVTPHHRLPVLMSSAIATVVWLAIAQHWVPTRIAKLHLMVSMDPEVPLVKAQCVNCAAPQLLIPTWIAAARETTAGPLGALLEISELPALQIADMWLQEEGNTSSRHHDCVQVCSTLQFRGCRVQYTAT